MQLSLFIGNNFITQDDIPLEVEMDFKKFLNDAGVDPQYHEQMVADLAAVKAVGGVFLPNGNQEVNNAFKNLWHESGLVYKVLPGVGLLVSTAKRGAPKAEAKSEAETLKIKMEEQAKKIALLEAALASLPAGKPLEEVLKGNGEKIAAPDSKPPTQVQRRSGRSSAPPPVDI